MKKHFLLIASMALMLVACGNPSKMAKSADVLYADCTPEVLEAVNGKIAANYTINFPAKYFLSNAILELTPVMVYAGGEVAGPVYTLQGDKVMDNNNVISYKNGVRAGVQAFSLIAFFDSNTLTNDGKHVASSTTVHPLTSIEEYRKLISK